MNAATSSATEPSLATVSSPGSWGLLMAIAAAMLALDQGVKWFVAQHLPLGTSIAVTEWFNLVHVLNPGAAFSFLADAGGWQRHALTALGVVVSVVLAGLLWRGNVVDRIRIGAVVDYLDLHWRDMHWPAFNLADIFIVGSVALLLLATLRPGANGQRAGQGGTG